MSKRAGDLSVEELAAMGAKAAHLAARDSLAAGLVVTGTIDTFEKGQAVSSLAQLLPSGAVVLVRDSDDLSGEAVATEVKLIRDREAD